LDFIRPAGRRVLATRQSESIEETTMNIRSLANLLVILFLCASGHGESPKEPSGGGAFVHPGLLHSAADLERIKTKVAAGEEPWASAWRAFTNQNRWIAINYRPRPLEIAGRGVGATGMAEISNDCTAAYYNAIAWVVTGDERYARKSVEIMNAWSYQCKEINGKDAVLCAGIYGYKLMNAAEIIRATYPGWTERDIAQFKHLAREVFYPVIKDFATFANGNWDASAEAAMISIAVFLDDRAMFDRAARYYLAGSGDGSVLHYVINDTGELQETGRDQQHAQLGIGLLSCVAQVAWNQGVDLYGAYDNRLLKGFEYTAKYNLGEEVPFVPTSDRTGKYIHARPSVRTGRFIQIYEMVYNHYVNQAGVPAPYTSRVAAAHRPETLEIDQIGAGTLLFSQPTFKSAATNTVPAIPGPMLATYSEKGNSFLWPASVGASSYTLKRAAAPSGPYGVISEKIKDLKFTDITARPGHVFYYVLSAVNADGQSGDSLPIGASSGLPEPWSSQDVGKPGVKGYSQYDGATFVLECAGRDIGGSFDQFHWNAVPLKGEGALRARYVPQTPSQFAKLGLMMRETAAPNARYVALLITPEATDDIEVPHWHLEMSARLTDSDKAITIARSPKLEEPFVTWGRLMSPFWLRLTRAGDTFTGLFSPDGQSWTQIGVTNLPLKSEITGGLAGCSRIKGSTTIMFDHVSAPGWRTK